MNPTFEQLLDAIRELEGIFTARELTLYISEDDKKAFKLLVEVAMGRYLDEDNR